MESPSDKSEGNLSDKTCLADPTQTILESTEKSIVHHRDSLLTIPNHETALNLKHTTQENTCDDETSSDTADNTVTNPDLRELQTGKNNTDCILKAETSALKRDYIEEFFNSTHYKYESFNFMSECDIEEMLEHIENEIKTNPWKHFEHRQAGAIITKKIGILPKPQFKLLSNLLLTFSNHYPEELKYTLFQPKIKNT